ncbi:LysM peptidoglycan-binding domain-containing protein [Breoghania sp.]|uniref:LysM peptidoglycan-binding domain-containing protein n=1 Tax=Breoghania sp. TaxID=2065378 RepID=UPI0029CAA6CD|nr:LysM peptidoglycan-binding domain-containing protein [Breoghania sp.]
MNKVVFAGLFGIVVAVLLAVFGVQTGVFDGFRKPPATEDKVAAVAPDDATKPAATSSKAVDASSPSQKSADTAPAETEAPAMTPTFDVVRVEPTGDAVVAGLSEPNATVALVANGKVIGKTKSNASGEWAIVLDKPLAPGDYDVAIHVEQANGVQVESSQRVAVSIPSEKTGGDVLVVMNAEGEASTILQRPAGLTPPAAPAVVASSEADREASVGTVVPGANEPPAAGREETARASDANVETGSGGEDTATENASGETRVADRAAQSADSAAPTASGQAGEATPAAGFDASAGASGVSTPVATASAQPEPAQAAVAGQVTVDAVESEKGKLFVAGTSKPDARLRVYLGSDYLGETQTNRNGRWLLETEHPVDPGRHDVRADVIKDDSGTVAARAQVTFNRQPDAVILTQVTAAGEAGEGAGASASASARLPNVIIRKGDNLWTISRRLYGKGMRYTTIYQANQGQIRNPDLIYPGQVFLTPVGDDAWEKDATTN